MRNLFCGLLLALFLAPTLAPLAEATSLDPLTIEDATLLPLNRGEFRLGFAYKDNKPNLFQENNLNRKEMTSPGLSLRLGLAERVELLLRYRLVYAEDDVYGSNYGSGDLEISTKIRLLQEDLSTPAVALLLTTKLPNGDSDKNLGSDETDFGFDLLATRNYASFSLFSALGMRLLGEPDGGQDDKLHYALGVRVPLLEQRLDFLTGVEGVEIGRHFNRRGVFQAGLQYIFSSATFDIGGTVGYRAESEDWSVRAGLTTWFELPSSW
ncbi:MAG: hypothetical protein C0616_04160 [Desulfuromonas sp.]|nr:MAG: hypothetical protein C0616_04160 [Desulfuromonas sp.]